MKLHSLRVAASLTAALTTAVSPLLASAQTAYEYKKYTPGLVVSGTGSGQAPGSGGSTSSQPGLQLSTTAINFGDVATHTTETRQVLVSNPGTGSLSLTAAPAVTGAVAFAAGLTTCGASLAVGADCLAEVKFSPTTAGTYNGVLKFTSVLASSPHEVTLVGASFNPVSLASTTLPQGMVGRAYSYDFKQLLNVSNEASPDKSQATWSGSGTLPTGLSFNTGTGVLSGTPSVLNPGAEYTVTGNYKNNQGQQVYTIKVGDAVLEVVQISAGVNHTCAVTIAGSLKCWGGNNFGQLGDNSATSRVTPVGVTGLDSGVVSVAAGDYYTCAVTTSGIAICWGRNDYGQLGDNSTTQRSVPGVVYGLTGVASVEAGGFHTCAVLTGGLTKCWGYNAYGQLGDGTTTLRLAPVGVTGLTGVVSVAAGLNHTCAVTTSGAAKCWGYNANGQLGDGSKTARSTPVAVIGWESGVASLATGNYHTCVVTTAGGAKCLGTNNYGQVGDGSATTRTTPVIVSGLGSGVASVAAGGEHTCAVTTAGEVKCWGKNSTGQLGNGNTGNQATPVAVSGLSSGIASVVTGANYTCAAATSGAAKCWGTNSVGQLGNGSVAATVAAPVNVLP